MFVWYPNNRASKEDGMNHAFLVEGAISTDDVGRLIELTGDGSLRWKHSDSFNAYEAHPVAAGAANSHIASAEAIGDNLRGVRMGYDPTDQQWHYLRLTAGNGQYCYLEAGLSPELKLLVDQFYQLVRKAARLGGTLKSVADVVHSCEACGKDTPHKRLIDSPHGLDGAYMAGSERLTCTVCESSIRESTLYKA
jgi:hypothetical protein